MNNSRLYLFLGTLLFVRGVVANHYYIPSESMLPTLEVGDHVLVYRRAFVNDSPQRGDVVVFEDVRGSGILLVKRLVAGPGDQVEMVNGRLLINDVPATYEWLSENFGITRWKECWETNCREILQDANKSSHESQNILPFEVPENHYFMLGDNRDNSSDSRYWGFVPFENIVGLGTRILWNMKRDLSFEGDLRRVGQKL